MAERLSEGSDRQLRVATTGDPRPVPPEASGADLCTMSSFCGVECCRQASGDGWSVRPDRSSSSGREAPARVLGCETSSGTPHGSTCSSYQTYLADPAQFAAELGAAPVGSWVVVDEVQRLPALLNDVHRSIESRRIKFALSGSSARKLRRGGTNLLGGRAVTRTMFPFAPEELGTSFDLDDALTRGTLPLVVAADSPTETLAAYVQTYLKQEIQAEAIVRNLPGFARFLPIAALFHGQALNVASLARDAGVSRTTVDGYVEILEDTLLATRLAAFEGKLRVRERKHPKLFFVDPGVVRALKHQLGARRERAGGGAPQDRRLSGRAAARDSRWHRGLAFRPLRCRARRRQDLSERRTDRSVAAQRRPQARPGPTLLRGGRTERK